MPLHIRMERAHDLESDRAVIDTMWRDFDQEEFSPEALRTLPVDRAGDHPTGRFLLVEADGGVYAAMAGAVLPGRDACFGFEKAIRFPHPALPTSEREALSEGRILYVVPAYRREGLAWALTFLVMALCWDAGAAYHVAENNAVSLDMARSVGFENTGIIAHHGRRGPYYLMVGRTFDVLAASFPVAREALARFTLDPGLQALLDRWSAVMRAG